MWRAISAVLLVLAATRQGAGDLSVVALGDWGGASDKEPTTESQTLTAGGLTKVAHALNASFAMMMGDNFYYHGVGSTDLSSRFQETFEAVYAQMLPGRPCYAFAGNHDYGEGVLSNVSAQVAYTQRSGQWVFPKLWYKIHRTFEAGGVVRSLDMLVIDTVVLCGNGPENEGFINQELEFLGDECRPKTSFFGLWTQSRREAAAEAQWAWLEAEMSSSKADFLWVAGHYPIWSTGWDGPTPCLIERLRPMLMAHGAHYISGHDHMLEHFHLDGLHTFVVGAGKECCYDAVNLKTAPPGALKYMLAGDLGKKSVPPAPFPVHGGFASMQFGAEAVAVRLHAHDGTVLHEVADISRRRHVGQATTSLTGQPAGLLRLWDVAAVPMMLSSIVLMAAVVVRRRQGAWRLRSGSQPLLE